MPKPHRTALLDDAQPPSEPRDVMFVVGRDADGDVGVIRKRDDRFEIGRLQEAKEGVPICGELVSLRRRPEHAQLFDVEVVHDGRVAAARSGPPRVSTKAYRENWDRIFGDRPRDRATEN